MEGRREKGRGKEVGEEGDSAAVGGEKKWGLCCGRDFVNFF